MLATIEYRRRQISKYRLVKVTQLILDDRNVFWCQHGRPISTSGSGGPRLTVWLYCELFLHLFWRRVARVSVGDWDSVLWTDWRGRRNNPLNRDTRGRHLANTIEWFVVGSDAGCRYTTITAAPNSHYLDMVWCLLWSCNETTCTTVPREIQLVMFEFKKFRLSSLAPLRLYNVQGTFHYT